MVFSELVKNQQFSEPQKIKCHQNLQHSRRVRLVFDAAGQPSVTTIQISPYSDIHCAGFDVREIQD